MEEEIFDDAQPSTVDKMDNTKSDDEEFRLECDSKRRRGEYGFYPPNLRARIAKMALEKGVSKAADHFSDDTGRFVSPSTVASIRNQYLKEVSQCIEEDVIKISELPKADTGRPLLLEELDSHIALCVSKIKDSGGAITAAVIKRIARDIIIANNKSLLLEFGGPFELSNAWAERTMKNIGVTRSSKKKDSRDKETSRVTENDSTVPKPRRSQRERTKVTSSEFDDQTEQSDVSKLSENGLSNRQTKYKLVVRPMTRGKQNPQRRYRILRVPVRNLPRRCTQRKNTKVDNGEKINENLDNVDIPEKDLIEMAIPCSTGKRKRGDYATYTSEQRVKMAKMALELGVAKTAQHFTNELGRFVSPSSIASMRNQYRKEMEKSQSDVVELPKGKRGRPLLLGHLDSEIKNAVERIKSSGGKVGRNIVKSVARDIIMANNSALLKEYGGPLQLTNTWAESVMKRMGFVRRRKENVRNLKSRVIGGKNIANEMEVLNQAYIDVINNAMNTGDQSQVITNQLIPNYEFTQNDGLVSNNAFNPNHHVNLTNQAPTMTRPTNHHHHAIMEDEAAAIMGLNHLRNQVDAYTPGPSFNNNSNNNNGYYGSWNSHVDFSVNCNYQHQHHQHETQVSVLTQDEITTTHNLIEANNINQTPINLSPLNETTNFQQTSQLESETINIGEETNSVMQEINQDVVEVDNNLVPKEQSITEPSEKSGKKLDNKKGKTKTKKKAKQEKRKRGEYGVYTAEQRMQMAKKALEFGVTKAASMISEELGRSVSSSTVASMRNLYVRELERTNGEINELPKGKRGRPLLLGDLDCQIQKCLVNIRTNGGVITRMVVVSVARGIILAKNKLLLKENGGPVELSTTWAESVIRRMGFVRQKTENAEKALPPDFDKLKSAFLKRIKTVVTTYSIPHQLILNFGQTALKIVPSSSWTTETNDHSQLPTVEIEDRREITAILTVTLSGGLLPLQLVYTGKTDQCHPNVLFPQGWNVTHTENHLCTSETVSNFIDKILIPYLQKTRSSLGLPPNQKALVIFDVLNMNQDKDFFTTLRDNDVEVVLVPTPCTHLLQPLKLVIFGRFRDELYKLFVNWYSAEVCEAVRAGQNPSSVIVDLRLSVLKHLHAQWILKTHQLVASDVSSVLEGFAKAGIIQELAG